MSTTWHSAIRLPAAQALNDSEVVYSKGKRRDSMHKKNKKGV
jgi:hypothetical protein